MGKNCENLSLYVIGELSKNEKQEFENHLKTCAHCQSEINSLQDTWQALAYDMEEVEVPQSLKAEVMDFIFEDSNKVEHIEKKEQSVFDRFKSVFARHFSPLSGVVTAVLIIGLSGVLWHNLQLKEKISTLKSEEIDPAQIVTSFALQGQDLAAKANGTAYIIKQGRDTRLVVELSNMPQTNKEEVYQVWLLKNGNRQNAGTLKPDSKGNGLITYLLPKDLSFDDIGITLEPNALNTQPKGKKVMGTS